MDTVNCWIITSTEKQQTFVVIGDGLQLLESLDTFIPMMTLPDFRLEIHSAPCWIASNDDPPQPGAGE
jgi:hypothetical protein